MLYSEEIVETSICAHLLTLINSKLWHVLLRVSLVLLRSIGFLSNVIQPWTVWKTNIISKDMNNSDEKFRRNVGCIVFRGGRIYFGGCCRCTDLMNENYSSASPEHANFRISASNRLHGFVDVIVVNMKSGWAVSPLNFRKQNTTWTRPVLNFLKQRIALTIFIDTGKQYTFKCAWDAESLLAIWTWSCFHPALTYYLTFLDYTLR